MSSINTNNLDVNYPVPGVNNNSQGFRNNFASIKTNLDAAGSEITDLQNKAVVKQALANTTLNNDMANTLISNAAIRSFRATTLNLGGALSGTVKINASLGDVQYGTLSANSNVTLQFGNWAPDGTQSNVQLILNVVDSNSYIRFGGTSVNNSVTTLENYQYDSGNLAIHASNGVSQMSFRCSTTDCGNTITVEPYDRPRQSTEIQTLSQISPVGFQGDVPGTVSMGPSYDQLGISSTNASDYFTTSGSTAQLYTDMPVVFTGVSMEANITVGTTYYVRNVVSSTTFTVSSTIGGANVNLAGNSSPTSAMFAGPVTSLFICTDTYNATTYAKTVSGTDSSGNVTLNNTTSLTTNSPIIFTGNVVGGLVANAVYYIKTIGTGGNITISQSRTNGVAGTATTITTATPSTSLNATAYIGSDIWKKINLTSW